MLEDERGAGTVESNDELRALASRSVYLTEHIVLKVTQLVRDLAQGDYCVLAYLEACSGSATAVEISDEVALTRPRITQIINVLEQRGFVEREKDEFDRRKINIRITDKGRETVRTQRENAIESHMRFLTWMGDDAEPLVDLLEKSLGYFIEREDREQTK